MIKRVSIALICVLFFLPLLNKTVADSPEYNDLVRPASKLMAFDRWFSIPAAGISEIKTNGDMLKISGMGAVAYKNKIHFTVLSFVISINFGSEQKELIEPNQMVLFQFNKTRRDSYFNQTLTNDDTNYSYGLTFAKNGRIRLIKMSRGRQAEDLLTIPEKFDFASPQKITIASKEIEKGKIEFIISFNDQKKNYVAIDEKRDCRFNSSGFIGIGVLDLETTVQIKDFRLAGEEEDTNLGCKPKPLYLLDYFEEHGKRIIHWRYNEGNSDYYKVRICDANGNPIDEVHYPCDRYILLRSYGTQKKLHITPVNIDENSGQTQELLLKDTSSHLKGFDTERVGVKKSEPYASFYLKSSGKPFFIKGFNYIRLRFGDHATFDAQTKRTPACYDAYDSETMLKVLSQNGYNTVRIFIIGRSPWNPGIAGDYDKTEDLYSPYMDNVVDFLIRAKRYGIYVLPTFGDGGLPYNRYYVKLAKTIPDGPEELYRSHSGLNAIYLTSTGIELKKRHVAKFLKYIKEKDETLLKILLGVEFQNELSMSNKQWPFNLTSGKLKMPDGGEYDMSDKKQRQALMDNGINYYHNTLTKEVKQIDPELLTAESIFTLRAVEKNSQNDIGVYPAPSSDPRFPPTAVILARSDLDFVDIHFYYTRKNESVDDAFRKDMESIDFYTAEMTKIRKTKPVILGEFGSFKFVDNTIEKAAGTILTTRDAAIKNNNMMGFMLWTFDAFEQKELYNAMDDGGILLQRLSQPQ